MKLSCLLIVVASCCALASQGCAQQGYADTPNALPRGWETTAPRPEVSPEFRHEPRGGPDGESALVIRADAREGLDGAWVRTYEVIGGRWYQFSALYKARGVAIQRRSIVPKLEWRDAQGQRVLLDEPTVAGYLKGSKGLAETEFPATSASNEEGWTEVIGVYQAPQAASQARVSLHLQWAPGGEVAWSRVALVETSAPPANTKKCVCR